MVDADQVHLAFAGGFVGGQQIFRAELVAGRLGSREGVLEGHDGAHGFLVAVGGAQHGSATFIGVGVAGVLHHGLPGFGVHLNHSSSQKCSLRYLSAPSQSTVTMVADSPRSAASRASRVAACTLAPEEMPTSRPSRRARRRTIL